MAKGKKKSKKRARKGSKKKVTRKTRGSRGWWADLVAQVEQAIQQTAASTSTTRKPRKKALLIGINKYKMPGADLRGCVNDVENVAGVLQQYCGFTSRNIKKVLDYKATTARMKDEIVKLVAGAVRGDVLYLHYSGHGSNVPDKAGDEADTRDEILCPTDLDWNNPLVDDFIRATFATLPKGVNLTFVSDSCHSGSVNRAILPPDSKEPIERYLPCPLDMMAAESGRGLKGRSRGKMASLRRSAKKRRAVKKNVAVVNVPDVLLSGCRDDQTSADAYIGGTYNGAMSYNMVQAVKAKKGKLTLRSLHAETLARVKKGGYAQVPQLSGKKANLDHPFLQPYV